jgi:hypothetical protein
MSDIVSPVTPTVSPTPAETQAALAPLLKDAGAAVPIVKQVIADVKAGGIAAALKDLPAVTAEAEALYADVKLALPTIKAGYKTTEFWLVVGFLGTITGFAAAGHPLPVEADAILGAVIAVYTAVRALVKKAPVVSVPVAA